MANLNFIAKNLNLKVLYNTYDSIPERTPDTVELYGEKGLYSPDSFYLQENEGITSVLFYDGGRIDFECDLTKLFNAIASNNAFISKSRKNFDELVDRGAGLPSYIELAAKMSSGSAAFMNPRGRIVSYFGRVYDDLADYIVDENFLSTTFFELLFGCDSTNKYGYYHGDASCDDYFAGKYFDDDGELIGIIMLSTCYKDLYDARSVCDILMGYMEKRLGPNFSETSISPRMTALKKCWTMIMDSELTGHREICDAFAHINLPLNEYVRVGILSVRNPNIRIPYNYFNARIHSFYPNVLITSFHDDIVLIINEDAAGKSHELTSEQKDKLILLLKRYDAKLMFGNATNNMSALRSSFLMLKRTLSVAEKIEIGIDKNLFYYEDYCSYNIIDMATKKYEEYEGTEDVLCLIHPAAVKLTEYDRLKNTNLRNIVYYYLTNDRNILKTSSVVNINRNTLVQKIDLAKKIMDVDLEDAMLRQRIIFSCQFLLYYEGVLKN